MYLLLYKQLYKLSHTSKLMHKNISDSIAKSNINGYKLFDVNIQLIKSSNCKSKPVARLGDRAYLGLRGVREGGGGGGGGELDRCVHDVD